MRQKFLLATLALTVNLIAPALPLAIFVTPALAECSDSPDKKVDWQGCRKRNLMLTDTNLEDANLKETNFTSTDMRNSHFDKADFYKAVLIRVAFDDSSAKNANFEKAIGYRVSFRRTDLTDANFKKSEMQRVDFSGSRLTNVDFSKSEVGRTVYNETILGNNNFSFANVARADFRKAILNGPIEFGGAFFFQTRFEGVDLTKTTGLQQWQIDMACGDAKTKLPPGLNASASWPCVDQ